MSSVGGVVVAPIQKGRSRGPRASRGTPWERFPNLGALVEQRRKLVDRSLRSPDLVLCLSRRQACSLSHKGTGVHGSRAPELFPMGKPKGRSRRPLSPCPFYLPSDASQNATTQTIGDLLEHSSRRGSEAPMGRGALWSRVKPLSPSTQPEELEQLRESLRLIRSRLPNTDLQLNRERGVPTVVLSVRPYRMP